MNGIVLSWFQSSSAGTKSRNASCPHAPRYCRLSDRYLRVVSRGAPGLTMRFRLSRLRQMWYLLQRIPTSSKPMSAWLWGGNYCSHGLRRESDHDLVRIDASHLFASSVTHIGFRRGTFCAATCWIDSILRPPFGFTNRRAGAGMRNGRRTRNVFRGYRTACSLAQHIR